MNDAAYAHDKQGSKSLLIPIDGNHELFRQPSPLQHYSKKAQKTTYYNGVATMPVFFSRILEGVLLCERLLI